MTIHQSIAGSGATPVGEPHSPAGSRSLPRPFRINAWRGASKADVEETILRADLAFQLSKSAISELLHNLNENLPITATIDVNGIIEQISNAQRDATSALMNASDYVP